MAYKTLRIRGKSVSEHRAIMQLHINRELDRHEVVHHRNGNTLDNRIDNLQIMTHSDHARFHMIGNTNGINNVPPHPRGVANPRAKLTEADVRRIRAKLSAGELPGDLARKYGVGRTTIILWTR